ncbi:hypothetical protein ACJJTC_012266 [Scirpophaga incertulas]
MVMNTNGNCMSNRIGAQPWSGHQRVNFNQGAAASILIEIMWLIGRQHRGLSAALIVSSRGEIGMCRAIRRGEIEAGESSRVTHVTAAARQRPSPSIRQMARLGARDALHWFNSYCVESHQLTTLAFLFRNVLIEDQVIESSKTS